MRRQTETCNTQHIGELATAGTINLHHHHDVNFPPVPTFLLCHVANYGKSINHSLKVQRKFSVQGIIKTIILGIAYVRSSQNDL